MDAKEFIRELVRMCKSQDETCSDCQIFESVGCPLIVPENADADRLVAVVEKWSKENPVVMNGQKVHELIPADVRSTYFYPEYIRIRIDRSWWDAEFKGE